VIHLTNEKIQEIINDILEQKVTLPTVTRWRNGSRNPSQEVREKFENTLGLPIEIIYRDTDLKQLEQQLEIQLKNIRKLIKEYEKIQEMKMSNGESN
jgi:transcriptional regulator with XRE-family HTH domain